MAERRMFAKAVIRSDSFLDLPATARLLYYDLGMEGDDDGFVDSPRRIMKITGAADDDLKILISKQFIIPFENGLIVIRHWRAHNYLRSDRYKPTIYQREREMLTEGAGGIYDMPRYLGTSHVYRMDTVGIPSGSIGKGNIRKNSIGENTVDSDAVAPKPTARELDSFFESVWNLYPNKKGKAKVSKPKMEELFRIGFEELSRCVERYKADKPEWQSFQHGSTFFNSGYVDYLDANYSATTSYSEPARRFITTGEDDAGNPVGYWEDV